MKNGYLEMWDNWSKRRAGVPAYDLWLDEYKDILEKNKDTVILDLGCGIGADTLYLIERGYNVLSCDFSKEALKNVQANIPNSEILYLDMMKEFPIEDDAYSLIIADLSLHYFDNNMTFHIMNEIKRILKNDGILLARVASTNDFNFGAGLGQKLENNFYFEGDYTKRFFDFDDIIKYFGVIGSVEAKELSMTRNEDEYSKPKIVYTIKVKNGNANDYDKFAKKRQQDLINGVKPAHRFVEKPMMKSMIPNLKSKKVLMLGCGTGEESILLESFGVLPKDIVGIDLSSNSIKIAKESYPDIEFVIGDINDLPFDSNSFDFVYSSLAVHYSKTPEKIYREVYRVLKKDGLFLFSVAHPLRWSSEEKNIDGETIRLIGCSKSDQDNTVYG